MRIIRNGRAGKEKRLVVDQRQLLFFLVLKFDGYQLNLWKIFSGDIFNDFQKSIMIFRGQIIGLGETNCLLVF